MRRPALWASMVLFLFVVVFVDSLAMAEGRPWWPIQVKSYYGLYDAAQKTPGHASKSLDRARLEEWMPPTQVNRKYQIGVAFPHLKDPYWLAVNYGIIDEAKRLGLGVTLVQAGGYDELQRQREQLRELGESGVDGIIVGSISYTGINDVVADLRAQDIQVVETVNDVHAPGVTAKALVSYYDMGYYAGEYVVEHAEKAGLASVRVAFFPGPKASGWAPETLLGFRDALQHFPGKAEVVDVRWGDTDKPLQKKLVEESLHEIGDVEYIVGNAVTANVAPEVLRELDLTKMTTVVSTYMISALYEDIVKGRVAAAPSDLPVFLGRMAVDMMVRTLNGESPGKDFPFRSGPFMPMITTKNIKRFPYEGLFGPHDFGPVFELEQGE